MHAVGRLYRRSRTFSPTQIDYCKAGLLRIRLLCRASISRRSRLANTWQAFFVGISLDGSVSHSAASAVSSKRLASAASGWRRCDANRPPGPRARAFPSSGYDYCEPSLFARVMKTSATALQLRLRRCPFQSAMPAQMRESPASFPTPRMNSACSGNRYARISDRVAENVA